MSGLATIVSWRDGLGEPELLEGMLDAVPHRATEGRAALRCGPCVMGFARHTTTRREQEAAQPFHDAGRGLCVVADARLDNRDELAELLGHRGRSLSDPELLLHGYERWGTGLAERLCGDFAFVIWDVSRRELYAARDPFGIRPLYFHDGPARLALGSEVGQICSLPDVGWDLDEQTLLDYFSHSYRHTRRTFFRDVTRLAPGHYLLAREGTVREIRYWHPPREELRFARAEEYHEEFRRLFERAVADRLDSVHPIMVDLSGGLDSAAIACMADAIGRRDGDGRPPVRLISAIYPGLECDETPYIEAVARRVQLPAERFDGRVWNPTDDGLLRFDHPDIEAFAGVPEDSWHRVARDAGARVRLRGVGAEDVLLENGVLHDLAARGRWLTLIRQSALMSRCSSRPQREWIRHAVVNAVPPLTRRIYRRLRPRRPDAPEPPPAWLGPCLRAVWSAPLEELSVPATCSSEAQRYNWKELTDPHTCWMLDLLGYRDALRGVEVRFPFLDVRLARFVLAVPYEHRLLTTGRKELLRKGLADLLPESVATRYQGPAFDVSARGQIAPNLSRYASLLCDGTWLSAPYIDHRGAVSLLQRAKAADSELSSSEWKRAWQFLMLERWLRALHSSGPEFRPRHRAEPLQVPSLDPA